MPYRTIHELPSNVYNNLPEHALEIYLKAFNNAWDRYSDPARGLPPDLLEQIAHRIAWGAVKKVYRKNFVTGLWERSIRRV